ncbi:MAG: DUF3631 domain-containing protein [Gammaproteobacteria bacterium]
MTAASATSSPEYRAAVEAAGAEVLKAARNFRHTETGKTMTGDQVAAMIIPQAALFKDLAALKLDDRVLYELQAKTQAKNLGVSFGALNAEVDKLLPKSSGGSVKLQGTAMSFRDDEPWASAVNGDALLTELTEIIRRHVILTIHQARTIALWIVATYFVHEVNAAAILAVVSPEKRCGKTTMLSLLRRLVRRASPSSNITGAVLFREIEKYAPTLLIDEADTFLRDDEALRGILNSGHTRELAFVKRTVGDDFEPRAFSTFCFKSIACIGKLKDTLTDRSIIITMQREQNARRKCAKLRDTDPSVFERLRRQAVRFAADLHDDLQAAHPAFPEAMNDREADSWEPLFAISDLCGGAWPTQAREAALILTGGNDDESIGVTLLENIRSVFVDRDVDRLSGSDLVAALTADLESPWATFNHGNPISQRQVATRLRAFGIVSGTIREGGGTSKGYLRKQFAEAFARYIPLDPFQSVTPSQPNAGMASSEFSKRNTEEMLRIEKALQPNGGVGCDGVTDRNTPIEEPGGKAPVSDAEREAEAAEWEVVQADLCREVDL